MSTTAVKDAAKSVGKTLEAVIAATMGVSVVEKQDPKNNYIINKNQPQDPISEQLQKAIKPSKEIYTNVIELYDIWLDLEDLYTKHSNLNTGSPTVILTDALVKFGIPYAQARQWANESGIYI